MIDEFLFIWFILLSFITGYNFLTNNGTITKKRTNKQKLASITHSTAMIFLIYFSSLKLIFALPALIIYGLNIIGDVVLEEIESTDFSRALDYIFNLIYAFIYGCIIFGD